jgi:hypothetical protein
MAKQAVGEEGRVVAVCSGRNERMVKGLVLMRRVYLCVLRCRLLR